MHHHDAVCFVHTFPSFRSMRWYACHACLCHPLAFYASLHAGLHVHAWVLLASVSSMLQYNKVMDIRSKPTFVPCGHTFCLFSCLLSSRLFACFLVLYLPCLSCLSALCLFICFLHLFLPLPVCWFLVFAFAYTHMEQWCMELGHDLPGTSKNGANASRLI